MWQGSSQTASSNRHPYRNGLPPYIGRFTFEMNAHAWIGKPEKSPCDRYVERPLRCFDLPALSHHFTSSRFLAFQNDMMRVDRTREKGDVRIVGLIPSRRIRHHPQRLCARIPVSSFHTLPKPMPRIRQLSAFGTSKSPLSRLMSVVAWLIG